MAISLKNVGFLFVEDNDCISQALSMLKDDLFGINVEFCEKLITSALETYLVDKILSLPQRTIEQTYYLLYEAISKHQECKMLTAVTDVIMADTETVVAADSLGFTQQEKVNIFKMAASLMQLSQIPRPRKVKCIEKHLTELYSNILKPMVKVGKEFVPQGKAVESDAADLYNNILKPMVKVGKEFVPQGKAVESDAADLYNNILKPMVKVGKEFIYVEKNFFDQDIYGLKFLYFMEDMLRLMGAMRMYPTSMFMMSSEVMMPGSA